MPRVPATPPTGQPINPHATPVAPAPAATDPGIPTDPARLIDTQADDSLASAVGYPVAPPASSSWSDIPPERLQAAATELGLGDLSAMGADDLAFVATFARGALDSFQGGDPDNPLIPTDAPSGSDHAAPPVDDPSATTVDGTQATSGSTVDLSGGAAPGTPGGTTSQDGDPANVIPPAAPAMVNVPGVGLIPADQVRGALQQPQLTPEEAAFLALRRQGLVAQTFVDPMTQQPIMPNYTPGYQPGLPPTPAQPPAQPTPDDDYIDTRAGAEIAQLRAQQQTIIDSQRQIAQRVLADQSAALERELVAASAEYQTARGLAPEELDELASTMTAMQTLPAYARMYEGDPRSAVKAALDNAYWSVPKFRDRELQRQLAAHAVQNATVDEKKAASQGIISSPGSVARTPPPPQNRDQRDSAMVAAIEAAQRNGELA